MKARLLGLIVMLTAVVGGMVAMMPTVAAKSAKDGWKSSYSAYCKSYNNFDFSPYTSTNASSSKFCGNSTAGEKWFSLLQRNDAANTTSGDCGDICSTNWFSTSAGNSEKTNPNDTIAVPGGLKNSDKLSVWMYSSQRVNRKQNAIKSGQSTYELFVKSMIGSDFGIKGDKGKKTGYINDAVGTCAAGTPNPYNGPVIIQRPGISGMSNLGKYGGSPSSVVNYGVQVSFNVGRLRKIAADYKAGKISKYVKVFQGLFYHGPNPGDASGCAYINLNAANIKLVPTGDIYPRLSVTSANEIALVGENTTKVQSSMTNSRASTYQVASKAAVYDFTVKSVNTAKLSAEFDDPYYTHVWNAGTNSVDDLCNKLPGLFVSGSVTSISDCSKVEGTYSKATYPGGTTGLDGAGKSLKTDDKPAGTIVCRVIVTNNFNGDNNGTKKLRASTPACFIVGKQPKLQIWGGDLRVGDDVDVSQSKIHGNYYGSWVEYGSFIKKLNQSNAFASGAALAGSHGSPTNNAAQLNGLTFANKTANGRYGEFDNPSLSLPASQNSIYAAMANNALQIPAGTGSFSSNLGALSGAYTVNGNATITTSHIPAHTTILLRVKGTATIKGNITYPNSFSGLGNISQVIIVANAINIKDNVSRIDAWLLAGTADGTGMINTCYNIGTLTTNNCQKTLETNGPVVSDAAKFRRTAGSDDPDKAGDPAERLDLRADSYLWEYNTASKHVIPTTVQITQLPPRY